MAEKKAARFPDPHEFQVPQDITLSVFQREGGMGE